MSTTEAAAPTASEPDGATDELRDLRARVDLLTTTLEGSDAAKFEAEALLSKSLTRSAELNAELRKARSGTARLQAELDSCKREVVDLQAKLVDRDEELEDLKRLCRDLRDALSNKASAATTPAGPED